MKSAFSLEALLSADAAELSARTAGGDGSLRVLHVVNRLDMGGTEFGILKVVSGLGKRDFVHRLCAIRGFHPGLANLPELRGNVLAAGVKERGLQFLLLRLARIMRTFKPHIVHSRNWGAIEAIPAARLARVPVVIHSDHGYELDMLAGLPLRQRLLRRAVYGMADAVFTVTAELRDYYERQVGVSSGQIRVIRNGVDTTRFAPRPRLRFNLRQKFHLPQDSFVVGTIGRMVPIKSHVTLLHAAGALASQGIDVRVLFAGSGPEAATLQRLVEASRELAGRVMFLGACENVPEVLNALDTFVLPSISEGMSNTLLEAMASGLSVVATRVGGNPELVEENRSGWLFTPGNVQELADRLGRLWRSAELRDQFGDAARDRIVAEFSLERMMADYRRLYQELAAQRGILARSGV